VRPRFIWGKGDTKILPEFIRRIKAGNFMFIGGGTHLTSVTHVRNVVEGLMKAAENGKSGEIYFVTDGKPVQLRDFVCKMLATKGVDGSKVPSVPFWIAYVGGFVGALPLAAVKLFGEECTLIDAKARKEIGYKGEVTVEEGLREMEEEGKINS